MPEAKELSERAKWVMACYGGSVKEIAEQAREQGAKEMREKCALQFEGVGVDGDNLARAIRKLPTSSEEHAPAQSENVT